MARRKLDTDLEHKRGQEPLTSSLWDDRIMKLVEYLKDKPRTAIQITKDMARKKKWSELYTKNTLAAADLAGKVRYRTKGNQWYV